MARAGARYRRPGRRRARSSTSSWTSSTRPGRASNDFTRRHARPDRRPSRARTVDLGQIEIAKHWRDTLAVKLGGDVAVIPDRLALRAGAFYETAVADAAYANVDFPGGPMFGGSIGGSLLFGRWEVALAYQLRHQPSVSVTRGERARLPAGARPAPACRPTPTPTPATRTTSASRRRPSTPARYTATSHLPRARAALSVRIVIEVPRRRHVHGSSIDVVRGVARGGARAVVLLARRRWPAAPLPSLEGGDLAQGPYSSMHMLLQKTVLNINVADIDVRFDKATQGRFAQLATRQAVLARARRTSWRWRRSTPSTRWCRCSSSATSRSTAGSAW